MQSLSTTCTTFGRVGSMLRVRQSSPSLSCAAEVAAAAGSFDEMLERPVVPVLVLSAAAVVAMFSSEKSGAGAELQATENAVKAKTKIETNGLERVIMVCSFLGGYPFFALGKSKFHDNAEYSCMGLYDPGKDRSVFES